MVHTHVQQTIVFLKCCSRTTKYHNFQKSPNFFGSKNSATLNICQKQIFNLIQYSKTQLYQIRSALNILAVNKNELD